MKVLFSIVFFLTFGLFACNTSNSSERTESFKVWGNCEKCKVTIETSLNVDGVIEKDWNGQWP